MRSSVDVRSSAGSGDADAATHDDDLGYRDTKTIMGVATVVVHDARTGS